MTGIAVTGVTDENVRVTVVEIGAVLLVMEALLPISEDDSIFPAIIVSSTLDGKTTKITFDFDCLSTDAVMWRMFCSLR